jgi:hypothetical protein
MSEYKVQSVVFNKDQISLDDAFDWLVVNGYKIKKSDETETQYRFRQLEPSYLKRKGFTEYRTKQLNDVVSLVLVYKK